MFEEAVGGGRRQVQVYKAVETEPRVGELEVEVASYMYSVGRPGCRVTQAERQRGAPATAVLSYGALATRSIRTQNLAWA